MLAPAVLLLLAACDPAEDPKMDPPETDGGTTPDGGMPTPDGGMPAPDGGRPDTSAAGLTAFVKSGAYKAWKAEPAVHDSAGPHGGKVRTYVNDVFYASLKAGNTSHPKGSIVVKELYGSSTTTVTGHAIDVKDEATGEWVFYEGFGPTYASPYYYRGTSNFCAGCHRGANNDYMLTPASAFP
jgi:hypothetical protein